MKYIVSAFFVLIITVAYLLFVALGSIERKGYFQIRHKYNIQSYEVKMSYYSKIFRNSDLYEVHINKEKSPRYITSITYTSAGNTISDITTSREFNYGDKIDDIYYTLKVKNSILFISSLVIFVLLLISYPITKNIIFKLNKSLNLFRLACIIILAFSLFIRVYHSYTQDGIFWDEYASIWFSNNRIDGWNTINSMPFENVLEYEKVYSGSDIKLKYHYDSPYIEDAINDIVSLYQNSKDPFLSNFYYSLLRISFIGRSIDNIKNIIITGTILNCIFYVLSFFFMTKLLKFIFKDDLFLVLCSLVCISLIPSSITSAMFLRPYSMQESFFVVFIYLVLNTMLNKKYSMKNFVLITIITGIGYLILFSSIIFVLCVSLMIFFYYLYSNWQYFRGFLGESRKVRFIYKKFIEDKTLLYFALSFFSAFMVSGIIYINFLPSLFNANNRARTRFPVSMLDYIDDFLFIDILLPLLIILAIYIIYCCLKGYFTNKQLNEMPYKKYIPILFVISASVLWSILANSMSPYTTARYNTPSFPLIFIILPFTLILLIDKDKIRYSVMIVISILYIATSLTTYNLEYIEKGIYDNALIFKEKPNLNVYGIDNMLSTMDTIYLEDNQNYIFIKDFNSLRKHITENDIDNFYLINNTELDFTTNQIVKEMPYYDVEQYSIYSSSHFDNFVIVELRKNMDASG